MGTIFLLPFYLANTSANGCHLCTFLLHCYCQQVCAVTVYSCVVPLSWRACPIPTLPCSLTKTGRSVPARCTLTAPPKPAGTPQHCPVASPKLAGSLQACALPLPCQNQGKYTIHTGAGFSFATYLEAIEELSGNVGQNMSSLHTLSLQLAGTSQKGANILV